MNKTLLSLSILASFLITGTSTEAQISTQQEDGTTWIIVDGTDSDDSVYVLESYGGVSVYLYNANGNLVDSKYFAGTDPIFQNQSPSWAGSSMFGRSLFGDTQEPEIIVLANLYGGDDYYYNNSHLFDADLVHCGTGRDTIYAGPGESWVACDYRTQGRKKIFGGGGDDWLAGGAGHDVIEGGDGDDIIRGNDGRDQLYGNAGDDDLYGGRGLDKLSGGTGRNTLRQ